MKSIAWKVTNEKYINEKCTNERYINEKNANEKYRDGKSIPMKGIWTKIIQTNSTRIRGRWMGSIRIENNIEWKTAFKYVYNITKWKVHTTK